MQLGLDVLDGLVDQAIGLQQANPGVDPEQEGGDVYKRQLDRLERSDKLRALMGDRFVKIYSAMKRQEYQAYFEVISPWEREFLLLNV